MEPTTRERGFVSYDMHQGLQDPALFWFYENWEEAIVVNIEDHPHAPEHAR